MAATKETENEPCDIRLVFLGGDPTARVCLVCKAHNQTALQSLAGAFLPRPQCREALRQAADKMAQKLDIKRWNDA